MSSPGTLIGFVPITDANRACGFYTDVIGLTFVHDDGFALVFRSEDPHEHGHQGNMVRLVRVEKFKPAPFTVLGWEVEDIAAEVKALTKRGATFTRYGFLQQDKNGIWTAPDGSKVAWFNDPDGNVLSLSEHA